MVLINLSLTEASAGWVCVQVEGQEQRLRRLEALLLEKSQGA